MRAHLTDPRPAAWSSDRRRLLGYAAAVWLSFGLIQCAQSYVYAHAVGREWSLATSLVTGMPWWISWFLVTPVIAFVTERYPFAAGRPWRTTGMHALACGVVCSLQLVVTGSVHWLTTARFAGVVPSLPNQVQRYFGNFFLESVVTYAGVTGVLVAIDFARAVRDEAVVRSRLEAEAAALEASVTKARLDALAMELNPHFLFNTLSAISALVGQDRRAEAREVIQRLGELLRQTLSGGGGQFSSVARELQLLEDYLFIQRVRFSDRLQIALEIEDAARECPIPAMLLQPLVENAIRHGVEPKEGPGRVRISIARSKAALRIEIADSCGGFSLNGNGMPVREGIGISNTRARLDHLYGGAATLTLENGREGGAVATVTVPVGFNGALPRPEDDA
jgi:two-component sensor histidine kinase